MGAWGALAPAALPVARPGRDRCAPTRRTPAGSGRPCLGMRTGLGRLCHAGIFGPYGAPARPAALCSARLAQPHRATDHSLCRRAQSSEVCDQIRLRWWLGGQIASRALPGENQLIRTCRAVLGNRRVTPADLLEPRRVPRGAPSSPVYSALATAYPSAVAAITARPALASPIRCTSSPAARSGASSPTSGARGVE